MPERRLHTHSAPHAGSTATGRDMDTDTETTALCPSGSHQASPPGTPTAGTGERELELYWGAENWGGNPHSRRAEQLCKLAA